MSSNLPRKAYGSLGLKACYLVTQFFVSVLLARLLGPAELGIYAFSIAVIHLLVVIAQFGFPASIVRRISVSKTQGRDADVKSQILGATLSVVFISALVVATAEAFVFAFGNALDESKTAVIAISLLLVLPFALSATFSGAIRGLGYVMLGQIHDQIGRALLFLSFIALIGASQDINFTARTALIAQIAAATIATTIGAWVLILRLPVLRANSGSRPPIAWGVQDSFPFLLMAGTQVINKNTDSIMIGLLSDTEQVGLYRVAIQFSDGLAIALVAISVVIAPKIASHHAKGEKAAIQNIVVSMHRLGVLLLAPAAIVIALFGKALIPFVFGAEYVSAAPALSVLVIGMALYATVGFTGITLSMIGQAKTAAFITFLAAGGNIVLNAFLIPRFGISGAAISTIVSVLAANLAGLYYCYRTFGMNLSVFGSASSKSES